MEINSNTIRSNIASESLGQKIEKPAQVEQASGDTTKTSVVPSTIVNISDQGMDLVKQAIAAGVDTYVEKTDEEYAKMSYEELIDERNGGKNPNWSLDNGATHGIRMNGKADYAASVKLGQQMWENGVTAVALKTSLKTFKESVAKIDSALAKGNFDISFVDGKATVVSKTLSKEDISKIQKVLDDKNNSTSTTLKNDIAKYNDAALKNINMMIYDEKGKYGGSDSAYVHRNEPISMKEFTENISYASVAGSEGGYTYQKHSEVIGSTSYGSKLVYKSS
jgi:hypothetical protein